MTFSRTALVAVVLTIGALAITDTAEACKRGRGGYGGYSRGRSSYGYGGYRAGYRPSYGGGYVHSQPPVQTAPPQQFAPQQPVAPQQPPQQFAPQQPVAPQQQPQQIAPQQQVQPQPQQPIAQQPAPQQTAPAPAQPNNAQNSALQALGGFAPPQQQPAPAQAPAPALAGTWTASLGNGSKVQLTLQADGTFSWTATNGQGQPSSFSGRYTMGTGSLTLIRSTDNEQLAGSVSNATGNGFSFKVAGENTAAINFSRA